MIKSKFNLSKLIFGLFLAFQIIGFTAILSCPLPAAAQTTDQKKSLDYYPQIQIPVQGSDFNKASTTVGQYIQTKAIDGTITGSMVSDLLPRYIRTLYNYALAIAGILATIVLMGGGVIWLTSGGDSGKVSQARELITGSITGIIILVVAWVILNTINPDLVNLKPLITPVVKRASFCCDPKFGGAAITSDGKCSSGVKCADGDSCLNTGDSIKGNAFSCINPNSYICCEYEQTTNSEWKECISQPMPRKADGSDRCPAKGTFQPTFIYKRPYAGTYCIHSVLHTSGSCLDATGNCIGKDDGAACDGDGSDGHCYNDACWFGLGKNVGEPCGNRGGSTCILAGNGCGKDAKGNELYHDKALSGDGRECGSDAKGNNLRCCNPKN